MELCLGLRFEGTTWKDEKCNGIDPILFPARKGMKPEVPMKYESHGHKIALEWFTRAHYVGNVSFAPKVPVWGGTDPTLVSTTSS